jgi:hypothetical protein
VAERMYRYEVPVDDRPHEVTSVGIAVHVEATAHTVEFWALHVDGATPATRTFQVFGTGHALPPNARWHGTAPRTPEGLVWHLFELVADDEGADRG